MIIIKEPQIQFHKNRPKRRSADENILTNKTNILPFPNANESLNIIQTNAVSADNLLSQFIKAIWMLFAFEFKHLITRQGHYVFQ